MAGLHTTLRSMLTSHLTVLRDFWPLVMLAIVGAVLATAYYWATKPGELLSFWAKWINGVYNGRTLLYKTPIPGKKGDIASLAGVTVSTYYEDAVESLKESDFTILAVYGIQIEQLDFGEYSVCYNKVCHRLRSKIDLDTYLSRLAGDELTYVDNDANEKRFNDYQWENMHLTTRRWFPNE